MVRKKIRICILCLMLAAGLTQAATVIYTTEANWSSKTVNDADTVVINNNATVTLDQTDTATIIRVNNSASPATGTLKIDQNQTLTALNSLQLGVGTGAGIITQSAGSVISPTVVINNSGTGDLSRYDLSGGSVSASVGVTVNNAGLLSISGGSMTASALTVNSGGAANLTGGTLNMNGTFTANGTVTVDGGTVARNISGVTTTIAGTNAVKMISGSYALTNGGVGDVILMNAALFEISGGDVELMGQLRVNTGSEFKVVGHAASIDTMRVNQFVLSGTFRFVFDTNGISTINAADTVNLTEALIVVDGSAYAGAAGTFDLFKGTALSVATNIITVSGFDSYGGAYVTQNTNGLVQLVVLDTTPSPFALTGSVQGGHGTVTPASTNVPPGGSATFTVTADSYYRIASLTTNGTPAGSFDNNSTSTNFIWSNVQSTGALVATFTAQLASDPAATPYWWLAQFGLTNFEADAVTDTDLDGHNSWQEYLAGTDPTNAASVLKVLRATTDGANDTVEWRSSSEATSYNLIYSTNLMNQTGWTVYSNNIAPTAPANIITITRPGQTVFYKITITN